MQLFTDTQLVDGGIKGGRKFVTFEHKGKNQTVFAEAILHGLGRRPNLEGLDLEKAGLETVTRRIQTNTEMQTKVPHIYAAGDCTGPHEIVHIAIQQGETAAYNIIHADKKKSMDYRVLVSVVFTDPQVAMVGLSEKEARAAGRNIVTADYPFNDHGKSMIMEAMHGSVKLIADAQTGELIGGACTGPNAGDLIHEVAVAVHQRMTAAEFAAVPHYHPTLAEIWTYPAEDIANKIAG